MCSVEFPFGNLNVYLTIFLCVPVSLFCSGPESDRNHARRVEATGSAHVVRTMHSCWVGTAGNLLLLVPFILSMGVFLPSLRLTLSYNDFTGTIPEVYGEFPYLTIFECVENLITGMYATVLV